MTVKKMLKEIPEGGKLTFNGIECINLGKYHHNSFIINSLDAKQSGSFWPGEGARGNKPICKLIDNSEYRTGTDRYFSVFGDTYIDYEQEEIDGEFLFPPINSL